MTAFPLWRLAEAARLLPDEGAWAWFVKGLAPPVRRALLEEWSWQAHGGQKAPEGEWRTWLLMAGRGFGKTRAGAEWIAARARETPGARIALVGGSEAEAARVMVEGPGGLMAAARVGDGMRWFPTPGVLKFGNGAEAYIYSGRSPEKLRGPEHHFAWADEIAKWPAGQGRGEAAWDNLQMGLRLGERPRMVATTTPRAVALLRRVRATDGTVETRGRTDENVHVAPAFVRWAAATYGGTRLGRQELEGKLFDEVAGALWTRDIIEASRHSGALPGWKRVVVGVDPPASSEGDACGIVVCAAGEDERLYVLADLSVAGARPDGWARAVARAAEAWKADRVVAEKNQGGEMVESVLRSAGEWLPVALVSASKGKSARAEPVATLFEAGKAKLAGCFPELEDELAGLTSGGGYEGPGRSPDRADAMVWAMTELGRPERAPPWIFQL